jgi:hypothetical protein
MLAVTIGILLGVAINPLLGRSKPPRWWVDSALCVHRYEGAWNDPFAPYYGGMQMDWSFMRHYGGWILNHHGTADHWRPATQLLVAYRGWKVQGWGAWPNTARICGLL